jgi:MYXO-CTERM domain-containing protein
MRYIGALAAVLWLATPTALAANPGDVVINEVAWSGSVAAAGDEWIELYNNTDQPVDLDGWVIVDDQGYATEATYTVSSAGCAGGDCILPADGYFLIELDDDAVSDIDADLLIGALDLDDAGDSLTLKDDQDTVIDFLDCAEESGGWYAGAASPEPLSMERVDPAAGGDAAANWASNDPAVAQNGTDSGGNATNGTPKQPNSATPVCVDNDSDGHCADVDCNDDDIYVYPGAEELCDQVDNDCDDQIDEDFPELGEPCDSDAPEDPDLCPNGVFECNPEQDGTICAGDVPTPEMCNGADDDCDEEVDEDWPQLGELCDGPDEDTCANGEYVCSADHAGVICSESGTSGVETCNGLDDDCDGQTDEDLGTYTCGHGVCMVTIDTCINGQPQNCVPAEKPEERESTCDDGEDNDCDGLIDEDDVDCRGGGGGDGCDCATAQASSAPAVGLVIMLLVLARIRRTRSPSS